MILPSKAIKFEVIERVRDWCSESIQSDDRQDVAEELNFWAEFLSERERRDAVNAFRKIQRESTR